MAECRYFIVCFLTVERHFISDFLNGINVRRELRIKYTYEKKEKERYTTDVLYTSLLWKFTSNIEMHHFAHGALISVSFICL